MALQRDGTRALVSAPIDQDLSGGAESLIRTAVRIVTGEGNVGVRPVAVDAHDDDAPIPLNGEVPGRYIARRADVGEDRPIGPEARIEAPARREAGHEDCPATARIVGVSRDHDLPIRLDGHAPDAVVLCPEGPHHLSILTEPGVEVSCGV